MESDSITPRQCLDKGNDPEIVAETPSENVDKHKGNKCPENHILLLTIVNVMYPITVDVVHQITEKYGEILRIVVFKKNRVQQAMVEFANVEMARAAKEVLNGANIYSGCCGVRIEYARTTKLNVYKNDNNGSWDFTTATHPVPTTLSEGSALLIICGLNLNNMNCDRLFNLFCLYGNVLQVKYLYYEGGSAIVQMGDAASADRAVYHLDGMTIFNTRMTISYYRQECNEGVSETFNMFDNSLSFKTYIHSKNNRFENVNITSKKSHEPQPPSRILHFYNTPPDLRQQDLQIIFPSSVGARLVRNKSGNSSSGHLHFDTMNDAIEALVLFNHFPVWPRSTDATHPYITKLCFSTATASPYGYNHPEAF